MKLINNSVTQFAKRILLLYWKSAYWELSVIFTCDV